MLRVKHCVHALSGKKLSSDMTMRYEDHHRLSMMFVVLLGVILIGDDRSALSAGQSCDVITPKHFEKLSLDKKIKVSEVIRECERKLKDIGKNVGSSQDEKRAVAYLQAPANRRGY
jgi:hypothetical protein